MSDPHANRPSTTVNNSTTPVVEKKSGNGMAFIIGALVVVVAIIAFAMFTGDDAVEATSTTSGADVVEEAPAVAAEPTSDPAPTADTGAAEAVDDAPAVDATDDATTAN